MEDILQESDDRRAVGVIVWESDLESEHGVCVRTFVARGGDSSVE